MPKNRWNALVPDARDTIAAIATAPGEAGIAIVRLSGSASLAIADRIFRGRSGLPSVQPPRTVLYGHVVDDGNVQIDEVLLLIMRAPHSYTREDVVEVQCHGGPACARRILRCVLEAGARMAEPGEFTQRAFLNGRLDLLQAEAVVDLIRARSDRAAAAAVEQMAGSLSGQFDALYGDLLAVASELEASLDFPEEDIPPIDMRRLYACLQAVHDRMRALLTTWDEGHVLREGLLVVISGQPNVGKSTLLNRLLGKDRAIVSSQPGTTRDLIEETFVLKGIPLRLVDTAGLRESDEAVEQEGVRRARIKIKLADINIHMIDASKALTDNDIHQYCRLNNDKTMLVLNKVDVGLAVDVSRLCMFNYVLTSLIEPGAENEVLGCLGKMIDKVIIYSSEPHATVSERHRSILNNAMEDLEQAIEDMLSGSEEMIAPAVSLIRSSAETLATATGKKYTEDILFEIFSRFCIGK
jgi:tRNA modification GTPase